MWKLLLLAVLANSFFLSLGIYKSRKAGKYWTKKYYYNNDSEEDSEENSDENENSNDSHYEETNKLGYEGNNYYFDKNKNDYNYDGKNDDNYDGKNENKYDGKKDNNYDENNEGYNNDEETDNYQERCSNKYPEKSSSNYPGSYTPFNCKGDSDDLCAGVIDKFNDGIFRAGIKLFKQYVDSSQSKPGAISPLGTLNLLSTLAIFGVGQTAAEIYALLNLSNRQEIECVLDQLNYFLQNLPCGVEFTGAGDIFGNVQYPFTDDFKDLMLNVISGAAVNLNFTNSERADNIVDGQVQLETDKRVNNVIEDSSIFNRSTELVGITGTYFSSPWETEFEISKKITEFYISPGKRVPGRFYSQCAIYGYAHSAELKAKAVQLPYQDNLFSLLVILPDEPFTENEVIDRMLKDPTGWPKRLCSQLKPTKVDVTIPAYTQSNVVDTRTLLIEGTSLRTIFRAETIQLEGVIENDIPAGVSIGLQKHCIEIPSKGCPVKKLPHGIPVKFVANIPHIWFLTFKNTVLYIGYTNGPTDGKCR